jgi:putative tryptophan/tyrosine transport system substrate-binding protein
VKRREFITLLTGAAAAWPLAARAQQPDRMRRIGVLINVAESDPVGKARLSAFVQRLKELGWTEGHNVRLDIRWGAGDHEAYRRYATELVALVPDVIVAVTSPIVAALQRATRTVPIVFAGVIDPVGGGFVNSLARPGGNSTGFALFEYTISVKWLELLKEIAPRLRRAAVLRDDPATAAAIGQFAAIQAAGPIGIELSVIGLNDARAIEKAVAAFARDSNGGLVVTASGFGSNHPDVIPNVGGPVQTPGGLPLPQLRQRRRPDLLWA